MAWKAAITAAEACLACRKGSTGGTTTCSNGRRDYLFSGTHVLSMSGMCVLSMSEGHVLSDSEGPLLAASETDWIRKRNRKRLRKRLRNLIETSSARKLWFSNQMSGIAIISITPTVYAVLKNTRSIYT